MNPISDWKDRVQAVIEDNAGKLNEVSQAIFKTPEPGLREYRAASLLAGEAEKSGFQVTTGVAGLDTAFVAEYKGRNPGPKIGFLAEYDAVPGLGHACGHNLIAASALGAALAARAAVDRWGGTIYLYGTPDEEAADERSKGGKVIMTDAGLFDGLDTVLMMHPVGGPGAAWCYTFPLKDMVIEYTGRTAHYTEPHKGINALEALILFINNITGIKRGWPSGILLAYTITHGGGPSPIAIPERAAAHFCLKAFDQALLEESYRQFIACAEHTSAMTGAGLNLRLHSQYKATIPNLHLAHLLHSNMREVGMDVQPPVSSQRDLEKRHFPGNSTDFGDVSWGVPAIHGYCSIGDRQLIGHTREFAAAAGGEPGRQAMLSSAKAMALTALDILVDDRLLPKIRAEFEKYKAEGFTNVPGIPPHYHPLPNEPALVYL